MQKFKVVYQMIKGGEEYARATFEIKAKDARAAEYRTWNLFSESTIADGDGLVLVSVENIEDQTQKEKEITNFCNWAIVATYGEKLEHEKVCAIFEYPFHAEEFAEKCLPAENRNRFSIRRLDQTEPKEGGRK